MSPRPAAVCVVTDRRRAFPNEPTSRQQLAAFERWLDEVVAAGPDLIQIREPDLDAATLRDLTARLVQRASGTACRIVVNDRADVAIAARADGTHLRGDGPSVPDVRRLGPSGWLVGRSVHSVAEVLEHQAADYLIFGTVFESVSKRHRAAAGLEAVRRAASSSVVPVLAIGGIDAGNAGDCIAAGAAGVAAIGAFLPAAASISAPGPARAVAALRAAMLQ